MKAKFGCFILGAGIYLSWAVGPALASSIHQYSVGVEATGGSGFTGVRVTRPDSTITGIPNSGCSVPYTGDPLYQTSWIIFGTSSNWNELGTGHQCSDSYTYWYWGYGASGVWHPLGEQRIFTLGSSHTFKIWRSAADGAETYYFDIDGVTKGTRVTTLSGSQVQVGLESYWYQANVIYANSSLGYTKNDGAFASWGGRDGTNIGALMCGAWVSDTSWSAGEGTPCL